MKYFNGSGCIPIHFKTIQELGTFVPKFKICNGSSEASIINTWIMIKALKNHCKNPCVEVEFFGRIQQWIDHGSPDVLTLNIKYASNEVKVQEQYYIYSTVDLIGIVGGNLGLFIGFSFFDKIKQMISFITNRLQN